MRVFLTNLRTGVFHAGRCGPALRSLPDLRGAYWLTEAEAIASGLQPCRQCARLLGAPAPVALADRRREREPSEPEEVMPA